MSMVSCATLSFFYRRTLNSKRPTIHFGFNACTFSDKPFSKKSCMSISGKSSTLRVEFTTGTILTKSNNSMTYNWFLTGLWWLSEVLPSCQDGFNSQTLGALNKNTAAKTANTTTTSWARTLLTSNGRSFIKGSGFIAVTWENKQMLLFEASVNCNAKRTTHNTNNKTFSLNEMQMKWRGILQFSEFMNWPTFKFPISQTFSHPARRSVAAILNGLLA